MPENPQIQQLLAALPEMFPGVQKIPLANIRLNPNNPGAKAAEEDIAELAANIALVGLKNAAKVMPDPAGPLAPGLAPHPDNFRLKADNTPWSLSDFRFLNLSGELRQLACQRLQWTVMDGLILNPTPEQAVEITDLDNDVRNKGWWAKYQSVEALIKANPNLKQREIGTRLRIDKEQVNWALRLLPLLNAEARGVLVRNPYKSGKGNKGISESAASRLTALGPGTGLKRGGTANDPPQALYPYPPIPPETQDLVYRTLVVACDHQMTEKQVGKLVEWVLAGNPPETFGHKAPIPPKTKPATGITPETIDKLVELGKQWGLAEARGEDAAPIQEQLKTFRESLTSLSSPKERSFKITSPEGIAILRQAWEKVKGLIQEVGSSELGSSQLKTSNSPLPATNSTSTSSSLQTPHLSSSSKGLQLAKKAGHWFVKIFWHRIIKTEHKICRYLAHAIVPSHISSHSSHRHHRSGSFSQGAGTLVMKILHGAVYVFIQFMVLWSLAMFFTSHWFTGLKPWVEFPFRFTARLALVDFPNWLIPYALIHWVMALLAGGLLLWGYGYALKVQRARMIILGIALTLIWIYGRRWADRPEPLFLPDVSKTQAASAPPVVSQMVGSSKLESAKVNHKTSNASLRTTNSKPVVTYQPAVSFVPSIENTKILELEIDSVKPDSLVKNFAVTPDEGMPDDLAVGRMQSVSDPDKYAMMIGSDKRIVLGINATAAALTINHKSADPFGNLGGLLGGSGPVNIIWEDVKAIHVSEIVTGIKNPSTTYQFSLISDGAKYPLTIQCSAAGDLEHLVSTMEYFIRHSRLGRDTPLTGMPYPLQGLVLTGDCAVNRLWADSPAGRGLNLGEYLWSVGKNTSEQQEKKVLEAGLQSLPVTLFVATPAEWEKAHMAARQPDGSDNANHIELRKVLLPL